MNDNKIDNKKSLKFKIGLCLSIIMILFILVTVFVCYAIYNNILASNPNIVFNISSSQLFWGLLIFESIIGFIVVIICLNMIQSNVIGPISKITNALNNKRDIELTNGGFAGIGNTENNFDFEEIKKQLKDIDIHSKDEIEMLYSSLQDNYYLVSEYIINLREDNWESEHDSMTMLNNRTKFERREVQVYPYVKSLYIACLDIINMKVVNETISTEAGDSIISKVARELRRLNCDSIHTYRMEDDHFAIVMCGYSLEESEEMIHRWLERVGRLNRATDTFECRLIYGYSYAEKDFSVNDVYRRADAEMFCRKQLVKKEIEKKEIGISDIDNNKKIEFIKKESEENNTSGGHKINSSITDEQNIDVHKNDNKDDIINESKEESNHTKIDFEDLNKEKEPDKEKESDKKKEPDKEKESDKEKELDKEKESIKEKESVKDLKDNFENKEVVEKKNVHSTKVADEIKHENMINKY